MLIPAAYRIGDNVLDSQVYYRHHNEWLPRAETLINTYEEEGKDYGQNVSSAFPLDDVFVEATSQENLKISMGRFVQIFFRKFILTPTKTEFGMFLARAAANRSADLSRQVEQAPGE